MNNPNLFEVIILGIDGGVAYQKRLLSQYDATVIPLREKVADVFFWCNKKVMDELRRLVAASCRTTKPKAIFLGSAVNHHPYIGLSMIKEPVTVIYFDNHSEFWREKLTKFSSFPSRDYWNREFIHHCGSWVIRVLKLPSIKKVVLFGVDGDFGINKFMCYPKGMWSNALIVFNSISPGFFNDLQKYHSRLWQKHLEKKLQEGIEFTRSILKKRSEKAFFVKKLTPTFYAKRCMFFSGIFRHMMFSGRQNIPAQMYSGM